MNKSNLILFAEQLSYAKKRYPDLKILSDKVGLPFLRGILSIPNERNEIVGYYLTEIHYQEKFPYRFPILYEIGGEIPNEANWHKYSDGRCCITVLADEILICKNGISVVMFISKYAIPFFANDIYKKLTGDYKNGEYAHGINGIDQFYTSLLMTSDKDLWIRFFKNTFEGLPVDVPRNKPCFCGSGTKYKFCHQKVFNDLRQIGEEQVRHDFKLIFNEK